MKSVAARRRAYLDRMQASQINPSLVSRNALQKSAYATSVGDFYPKQVILRDLMDGWGIAGPVAFQFEAFNAECYGVSRRFAGPAAVAQFTALVTKYEALGLDVDRLVSVAESCWSTDVGPAQVVLSLPLNGAIGVPIAGNLDWFAAARATGYDVWLYQTANPPAEVSHDQPGIVYPYVGLLNLTNYTWSIRSRNAAAGGPMSALWTFTTI